MPDIGIRFNKDTIIVDGAMGTMLVREGIDSAECSMELNVLEPELIATIHRRYKQAGAQCITTNTFGGSRAKLDGYGLGGRCAELNRAGVRVARSVHPQHVLADVGPCGLVMEPVGNATFDEVYAQYAEQIEALAAEGPDAILIETMVDIADARCALIAAKSVCDLPVIVSCTFGDNGRMELSGTDPATAAVILEGCGADVVGINCGLGPKQMLPLVEQMAGATTLPLLVRPNAGIPVMDRHGETVYPGSADDLLDCAQAYHRLGVQFLGSCCGSTPAFTGALAAVFTDADVVARRKPDGEGAYVRLASASRYVSLGPGRDTLIVGERINPTGKPQLAAELEELGMSTVLAFAEEQAAAGAQLLDVNVGAPMVDAVSALPRAILALTSLSPCPLVIDTTDEVALEAALKCYPGRALINSVNGEASSYAAVLPLAKRYGAAVIVLALDEDGIPADAAGRMAIIDRVRGAARGFGLNDRDLVADMLVMTAATSADAPHVTLAATQAATQAGLATVLGVSNVSHGLPNRLELNAAFIGAAVAAGLSAAIANPNNRVVCDAVALANASRGQFTLEQASGAWDKAYEAALQAIDAGGGDAGGGGGAGAAEQGGGGGVQIAATDGLRQAVLRGDGGSMPGWIDAIVAEGTEPSAIVDSMLAPIMTELGDAFARGEAFLPQMMLAANSMKAAVAHIKTLLPQAQAETAAGRVLFCTVKGDVHSIGKDICVALLESQDFKVYDLGVDVAPETVLEQARALDIDVVCLSALMTTTLPAMKQTVELLYREVPAYKEGAGKAVMVGGAVVNERWAASIDAIYSPSAPDCVQRIRAITAKGEV